ncbi:hypothetical protein [Bradyrhizobium genosp. P]|uniref:hypothetical protein n=1 Tax=Bradyrhizobium genosp. P TaxID=83641 RepID=UPI003CEE8586
MKKLTSSDFQSIRLGIASLPSDVSSDAVGSAVPRLDDIFAPQNHAAALDPATSIVVGARGTGKSFWSGVLGELKFTDHRFYRALGGDAEKITSNYSPISRFESDGSFQIAPSSAGHINIE